MLSRTAQSLLQKVNTGLIHPVHPKSLGLTSRLPRSTRLYIDSHSRVALALCTRRSRLAEQHVHALLALIRPLKRHGTVDDFFVAVEGGASVARAAKRAVEDMGGQVLTTDDMRALPKRGKHGDLQTNSNSEQGPEKAETEEACSSNPSSSGSRAADSSFLGETRLGTLSRRRRHEAMKRVRRKFELSTDYSPAGDQPKAIRFLTDGLLRQGREFQTLHGVTGSGKTFMMANIIANVNVPTLILAPNKTLAAQLCSELSKFFPNNRVEFFVSHFKYYQPEAYLPTTDKYIAKSSTIDQHIDQLRHAATRSLFERNDTIVVASVSSIYGLGLPTEYLEASLRIHVGDWFSRGIAELIEGLIALKYFENTHNQEVSRGFFWVGPDFVEVGPPWESEGTTYRVVFKENVVVKMACLNNSAEDDFDLGDELVLYPARHFVTPKERLEEAIDHIEEETRQCVESFRNNGKLLEATRLEEKVTLDIEMMRKVGYCNGAENYSLYLSGRNNGPKPAPPETLLDYMPRDGKWLLFIDESHVTVPQLSAMHAGNAARKRKLIQYGFRLPSAMENRPLNAKEFWQKTHQTIFVSATPGDFELERSGRDGVVEAIIRPTGVLDPTVEVVGTKGQVEHLTRTIAKVVAEGGKAIVTTLTKRFAEDLAECLAKKPPVPNVLNRSLRVSFLHSGIDSVGRMQVLEAMRENASSNGAIVNTEERESEGLDVVVGVNLLREGIDLPAVRLVTIFDASSQGFLRGETALIQTIGRAARNVDGHVIMYADSVTIAMQRAIEETARRRRLQIAYNSINNVIPKRVGLRITASHEEGDVLLNRIRKLRLEDGNSLAERTFSASSFSAPSLTAQKSVRHYLEGQGQNGLGNIDDLRVRMLQAAEAEDFETAAMLRDYLMQTKENASLKKAHETGMDGPRKRVEQPGQASYVE